MNMAKLRQILECRRATKMPPLLPPKRSKKQDEGKRNNQKEILDIHLKLREFIGTRKTENGGSIVCAFSESEETQRGPWKMTTASELLNPIFGKKYFELPNVFAIEFQLERQQYLRLDICDLLETQNEAKSFGYCVFSVSELVCARGGKIQRKLINDETCIEIAEALLSCTLRPKTHAIILQFAANNLYKKGINATTQIFFEIYRDDYFDNNDEYEIKNMDELIIKSNGQRKISISGSPTEEIIIGCSNTKNTNSLIYRSESLKWNSGRIIWRTFTLQSTEICGGNQQLRFRCLQELEQSTQILGEFTTNFNKLQKGQGFENIYFLNYENNKNRKKNAGTFELCRFHEAYNPSFLEYISAGSFLNLAFAVDFSRPDSAVDETTIRRYVSDVELSISAFGEPLREFQSSNSYAAFGLGAKIPPQFRESQEFCLNLETDPYCRGLSSVFSAFKTSFVNVQPLNMAHLSHVIYYVAKLAQNSLSRASPGLSSGNEAIADYNAPNYFVLVIITRGVFDDLKETIQAIIFASRSPISIIFVEICNDQKREEITELERLATAGTRLNYHGRKPERDCTQYVSIPSCRFEESKQNELKYLIAERGLSTIGQQMCTWMVRNGYQKVPPTVDVQMLDPLLTDVPRRKTSLSPSNLIAAGNRHQTVQMPQQSVDQLSGNVRYSISFPYDDFEKHPNNETKITKNSILRVTDPPLIDKKCFDLSKSSNNKFVTSNTVPVRKSTINAVKRQFRKLELHNFALSLPSSPRHLNNLMLNNSLGTDMRQQMFVESRSSSVRSPGRRIRKATTLIQFEKNQ